MLLQADTSVSPQLKAATDLLVNSEVIPALQRTIGAGLVLPAKVTLRATSHNEGHVPGCINPQTGEIVSVDEPIIRATENLHKLRYVLVHELAHYHELSVRKAKRIKVVGVAATQLWSEYFAQRVAWETGLLTVDTLESSEGLADATQPEKRQSEAYSWAYMLTFILAHADFDPDGWLNAYPGNEEYLRATVGNFHKVRGSDMLFRNFPWRTREEAKFASMVFQGMMRFSRKHGPR